MSDLSPAWTKPFECRNGTEIHSIAVFADEQNHLEHDCYEVRHLTASRRPSHSEDLSE